MADLHLEDLVGVDLTWGSSSSEPARGGWQQTPLLPHITSPYQLLISPTAKLDNSELVQF